MWLQEHQTVVDGLVAFILLILGNDFISNLIRQLSSFHSFAHDQCGAYDDTNSTVSTF